MKKENGAGGAKTTKGGPKRTKEQREADMAFITPLILKGYTINRIKGEIAAIRDYTISPVQIHKDIKAIVAEWHKQRGDYLDHRITLELQKLENLESIYWDQWELSKADKTKEVTKKTGKVGVDAAGDSIVNTDKVLKEAHVITSIGDIKWLEAVERCIQKRCEIMAKFMPEGTPPTGRGTGVTTVVFTTIDEPVEYAEEVIDITDAQGVTKQNLLS